MQVIRSQFLGTYATAKNSSFRLKISSTFPGLSVSWIEILEGLLVRVISGEVILKICRVLVFTHSKLLVGLSVVVDGISVVDVHNSVMFRISSFSYIAGDLHFADAIPLVRLFSIADSMSHSNPQSHEIGLFWM